MAAFFESARLWFRPPQESEVELLAGWINDPRVRKYLATRVFPMSLEAEREWLKKINPHTVPNPPPNVVLMFGPLGQEQPIGSTGLMNFNWVARQAEWGVLIGDVERWNQGFAREVAGRMLRYAFEELNLNRVELRVNAGNLGGVKAYRRAGFVHEGQLRQAAFVDGEFQDVILMSVLKAEWKSS